MSDRPFPFEARSAHEPVLETHRLRLRPLRAGDLDHLVCLDSDPEVRRFVDQPAAPSRQELAARLPDMLQRFGLTREPSYWTAEDPATGDFLGWFHLRPLEGEPGSLDLGYRLRRERWGRGLATEGSALLLERAFGELGAQRVTAHALEENLASRRVLEKLGLRLRLSYLHRGELPAVGYALERDDFLARRTG